MQTVNIGRSGANNGIWGNPFHAKPDERLKGKTLKPYEAYLRDRLRDDDEFRKQFYILMEKVENNEVRLWCPGCKEHSCERGICHGSIMLKVYDELLD